MPTPYVKNTVRYEMMLPENDSPKIKITVPFARLCTRRVGGETHFWFEDGLFREIVEEIRHSGFTVDRHSVVLGIFVPSLEEDTATCVLPLVVFQEASAILHFQHRWPWEPPPKVWVTLDDGRRVAVPITRIAGLVPQG